MAEREGGRPRVGEERRGEERRDEMRGEERRGADSGGKVKRIPDFGHRKMLANG